jgi:ubiquitin C-terminal hydrolase
MKGLPDPGGTSYLTAALQCLIFCPPLTMHLRDCARGTTAYDTNPRAKLASRLATAYAELVAEYWDEPGAAAADPAAVVAALRAACKGSFEAGGAHDAFAAMTALLAKLHEGMNRLKPGKGAGVADRCPTADAGAWATAHEDRSGVSRESVVSQVFTGQMEARTGDGAKVFHEHFNSLSLDVAASNSLHQCLHRYMAAGARRFTYLPRILVVHLDRFGGGDGTKNGKFVQYPFELSLCAFSVPGLADHAHYQLFAVCMHREGDREGDPAGRFAAMCEVQGAWHLMDGGGAATRVENLNDTIRNDAYVLLYKRLPPSVS